MSRLSIVDNGFRKRYGHEGGGANDRRLRLPGVNTRPWKRVKPANDNGPPAFLRLALWGLCLSIGLLALGFWAWSNNLVD
jgi:hypothetical protein